MLVQKNAFWLVSVGVLAAALSGCAAQNSNNAPQAMIYPVYNATYDAGQKTVVFHSAFMFGATPATASSIQLKDRSIVKINDTKMQESSKTSRIGAAPEYGYDYTLKDVAPETLNQPYTFTYVDNDGRTYTNKAQIPQPVAAQIPAEFDRAQGLQIPWTVADQLAKTETIRAQIKYPLSTGFYTAISKEGDKSGTLVVSAAEFTGFQPGKVQITVCRENAAATVNAANGGVLTADYCLPVQAVDMK